jgi:hypothetical protein
MKPSLIATLVVSIALLAVPVLAHEHHVYQIGDHHYAFTVGSLNEPIYVDDKTGVDLMVERMPEEEHAEEAVDESPPHEHEAAAERVTGLEETLKVELIAGGQTRVLALRPKWNQPGAYSAPFYPTVQTTYTYRFFGTIDDVPVDLSFTCNPAGHPKSEDDTIEVELSPGVTRHLKSGAFGCPVGKAEAGFPEPSASLAETTAALSAAQDLAEKAKLKAKKASALGLAGSLTGLLGVLLAGIALSRKRKAH